MTEQAKTFFGSLRRWTAINASAAILLLASAHVGGAMEDDAAAKAEKVFRAGAHAIDVTPQKLPVIVNGGMSERTAANVVDRLHARCLVLDDGTEKVAIVAVDSCVLPRALLDEAKRLAAAATGIPTSRMLISATHTHSAPSVYGVLGSGWEPGYGKFLAKRIAEGIESAHKNLAPARVGWAVGRDPKNVFCRRYIMKPGTARTNPFGGTDNDRAQMNPGYQNPNSVRRTGPVDTDVSVLSVQTREGRPIALLANYSTHYAGSPALSADYFGVFCRRIAELIGDGSAKPPMVGMLTNGTSGDANCCDFNHPRREFDRFTVGEDVARAAHEAYQRIRYYDWAPLVMEEKLLSLRVRMPGDDEVAKAKKLLAGLEGRKPRTIPEVYARETVVLSELPPTRELKLQAIRLGQLGIVAIPNEVFGITGLTIKRKSPLHKTFTVSMANGYEGYIPPPEQHKLGGYTTWRARSSCLEIHAEPKIVAGVLELLERVAGQRRTEKSVSPVK